MIEVQGLKIQEIDGCFTFRRKSHEDARGVFSELLPERVRLDKGGGLECKFFHTVASNISISEAGVLRGMHSQDANPQAKLVTCVEGEIIDAVFDIRIESPTFLQGFAIRLAADQPKSIYVPAGCLHGFWAVKRSSVAYSCDTQYDQNSAFSVSWKSPEISGLFPPGISTILSGNDLDAPTLREYLYGRFGWNKRLVDKFAHILK